MSMYALNLPEYEHRFQREGKKTKIFDHVRKKFLVLTPEEWVRQNFLYFLIRDRNYPASLISIEKGLKVNESFKRCDILIYNSFGKPVLLVECKSPTVKLTSETYHQAAMYNMTFKLPFLIVTNGVQHFCSQINFDTSTYSFLEDIPHYEQINHENVSQ